MAEHCGPLTREFPPTRGGTVARDQEARPALAFEMSAKKGTSLRVMRTRAMRCKLAKQIEPWPRAMSVMDSHLILLCAVALLRETWRLGYLNNNWLKADRTEESSGGITADSSVFPQACVTLRVLQHWIIRDVILETNYLSLCYPKAIEGIGWKIGSNDLSTVLKSKTVDLPSQYAHSSYWTHMGGEEGWY